MNFPKNPARAVLLLIMFTLPLRLIIAAVSGLGYGESYYVLNVLNPQLSYFDQPPLAFWLSSLSVEIFGGLSALSVRLPSIICFAITTWLMFLLGRKLFSARAGFYATLLLNLSAVFTITTATWLQPDSPLMMFWLATALCLAQIFFREDFANNNENSAAWKWWILAGIFLGLTTLSKYHAAFLFAGAGLFALTSSRHRHWLFHPAPYIALIINLIIASPIFIWNAQNNWVSFLFQSGRAGSGGDFTLHFDWLIGSICGQAIWLLPWIWLPLIWQLFVGLRSRKTNPAKWFCAMTAILPILFFTVVTLWAKLGFHFHWQAPGYLMLFLPLGFATANAIDGAKKIWLKRWLYLSVIACAIVMFVLQIHAATGFWRAQYFGPAWIASFFDEKDPTLEGFDYDALAEHLQKENWLDNPQIFLATTRWYHAGKMGWATRNAKPQKPILCLDSDQRNVKFLYSQDEMLGKDAILMTHLDESYIRNLTNDIFTNVEKLPDLEIIRGGVNELNLSLYYCKEMIKKYGE